MGRKHAAPPCDPGLEDIAAWEAGRLAATRQQMQGDGLDADVIASEYPAKAAMIRAAAAKMREQYLSNRSRSPR